MDLSGCEAVVVAGTIQDVEISGRNIYKPFTREIIRMVGLSLTILHSPHHRYRIPPQTAFGTVAH